MRFLPTDRPTKVAIKDARRKRLLQAITQSKESFLFLREFLRSPRQVASLIPSSRALERQLIEVAQICFARRIVELGPGTGGITRAILRAMPPEAQLLSIEINPCLCAVVERIADDRLILHRGDAGNLEAIVSEYGLNPPDVVISGVPMSTMGPVSASRFLEAVSKALAPEGSFVAYQVSKRIESLCSFHLDTETLERRLVVRNFPPIWIMRWEKTGYFEEPSVH